MQIRMAKPILWPGVVVCAVVLGVVSLSRVSAGTNQVDICHFDEETDSWTLLSLPQPAVAAHLANHDDALPGGRTSQTGTVLDADCIEVVTCPCEGRSNPTMTVTWDDTLNATRCHLFLNEIGVFDEIGVNEVHLSRGIVKVLSARGPQGSVGLDCRVSDLNNTALILNITVEEFEACAESIHQIAENDGVTCQPFN